MFNFSNQFNVFVIENEESSSCSIFLVFDITTDLGTFKSLSKGKVPPPKITIVKRTTVRVVVTKVSRFGPIQLMHNEKAIAPLRPLIFDIY